MTPSSHLVLALSAALVLVASPLVAGSLTPSGAPAPTMKTLEQVEPRTPITALPFTIDQPGSYYLVGNMIVDQIGILVAADDVTIDLMGFKMEYGGTGTHSGIFLDGTSSIRRNITVRNGTVRGFGTGIRLFAVEGVRIEGMTLIDNLNDGITLAMGADWSSRILVDNCVVSGNGLSGLRCTAGNSAGGVSEVVVANSIFTNNAYGGVEFFANGGTILDVSVVNCVAADNQTIGIGLVANSAGLMRGGNVLNCTASRNGQAGIRLVRSTRALVEGNRVSGTGAANTTGISSLDSLGNTLLRNYVSRKATNYIVDATNDAYGPIVSAAGELATTGAAAHPWANFSR